MKYISAKIKDETEKYIHINVSTENIIKTATMNSSKERGISAVLYL
ncbi:hypothetical protein LLG07_03075 [bacterium]|nr:hypothetical protein [bacterium]